MKFESFENIFIFLGCIVMLCISGWFVLDVESEKQSLSSFKETYGDVMSCDDRVMVSHRRGQRREIHSYKCIYRYVVDGRHYTAEQTVMAAELSRGTTIPREGGSVAVHYDPSNPQISIVFVRAVPKAAIVVLWLSIVGAWLACPFKSKIPIPFIGDAASCEKHSLIAFILYFLILVLLAKLIVVSGCSGFHSRTDPETGDVWGP